MAIELNDLRGVGALLIRWAGYEAGSLLYQEAKPRDVVDVVCARNPAIVEALRNRGWVEAVAFLESQKPAPESKTMAEAGARLVHVASSAMHVLDKILDGEVAATRSFAQGVSKTLQEAINNYTDNVAPPEDEGCDVPVLSPLRFRDVLPDEIDEDPKPLDPTWEPGAYVVMPKAEFEKLKGEHERNVDLLVAVRGLVVCLDSDTSDELQEPEKLVKRLAELVKERDEAAHEAERAMSLMLKQMGKETLARISAQKMQQEAEAEVEVRRLALLAGKEGEAAEREAARRLVHAAYQQMQHHLRAYGLPIAASPECTALNDAIHDWLDLQPEGDAKRATQEFLEARIRKPHAPAGGVTVEEFAVGAAAVGQASHLPPPPKVPAGMNADHALDVPEPLGWLGNKALDFLLGRVWPL